MDFRTRLNLREKHAKHLSDLRAYYEAEIQDLRHKLSDLSGGASLSLSATTACRETARERILQEENQSLRGQMRDLQDSLDDAHMSVLRIHSARLLSCASCLSYLMGNVAQWLESQNLNPKTMDF